MDYYVHEIGEHNPNHVGYYKDTLNSHDPKEDYRFRCNALVAVALGEGLLNIEHAKRHLELTEKLLIVNFILKSVKTRSELKLWIHMIRSTAPTTIITMLAMTFFLIKD